MNNFDLIIDNNKKWAEKMILNDPKYFQSLTKIHQPEYLWIGCSDSRVPANQIMGLKPGEVFVHRNIANIVPPSDLNVLAVLQYAVAILKVKDIIIVGHYGCGGIKAAFRSQNFGPLEGWLSHLRTLRSHYKEQLTGSEKQQQDYLVELNVKQQVLNVGRIPVVQKAWKKQQQLRVHGLVYNLHDGILKDLGIRLSSLMHIPSQFRIVQDVKVS